MNLGLFLDLGYGMLHGGASTPVGSYRFLTSLHNPVATSDGSRFLVRN